MFSAVIFAALTAGSVIAAPIAQRSQPAGWASGYLEDYQTYHTRYLALGCQNHHDTDFFDACCHPLLADETVSANRPSYCVPNATEISSAQAYEATASASDDAASAFNNATASVESVYESVAATATSSIGDAWTTDLITSTIGAQELASPTTTSTWVAPTTTSTKVAHTTHTTSTYVAPTTTSTTEAAATTASSSNSGEVYTGGYATYFYQGGNAGACGVVHSDSDKVIAIDTNGWWQDTSEASPYCGKYITITNTNNGKTVTAMVADACPSCDTNNSLDLSVGAFTAIATEEEGEVPITWVWSS